MGTIGIVITCHNYGRYLAQCIESVKAQSLQPGYVIVIDDGSKDNTQQVISDYSTYVHSTTTERSGLASAANTGIRRLLKMGCDYIVRLDADDWLHPDFCLVLGAYLDSHPDVSSVYCNHYIADEAGLVGAVPYPTDPPLGSCIMHRVEVFRRIGYYNEELSYQEDFEFWMRLTAHMKTHHISLPLWYYRRHDNNMSNAHNERMRTRQMIREQHARDTPRILAVIPARGNSKGVPKKNLRELAGVPLVARAIRMAKQCEHDMLIAVSTEDEEIAAIADKEGVAVIERPQELAEDDVSTIAVVKHAMEYMDDEYNWRAHYVVSIQPTDPFTPSESLGHAISTIMHRSADSVVSVSPITGTHPYRAYFLNEDNGLLPLFPEESELYLQRQDRPKFFGFTGGFYVRRRELLEHWNGKDFALGDHCIGVEVPEFAAVDIDTPIDMWVAEAIAKHLEWES